jgi:hypothetical protein
VKDAFKESCDYTVSAKYQDPRICANKWSGHGTKDDDNLKEFFPFHLIHVVKVGERYSENKGKERYYDRYLKTIYQCFEIVRIAKETFEVSQTSGPIRHIE